MSKEIDPYGDRPKVIHMAHQWNNRGGVSPLCADKPRSISLHKATWTIVPEYVTCPKCLKKMALTQPPNLTRDEQ